MAFNAKVGFFDTNTSTGNQSVTGVGFQPKSVVFFGGFNTTTEGNNTHARNSIGWAISSTSRATHGNSVKHNVSTPSSRRWRFTDKCYADVQHDSTSVLLDFDYVSNDADGFTVNITTADASARRIYYMALGGSDLSNVATGSVNITTSTGNQSVTGVGFQPSLVFAVQSLFSTTTGVANHGSWTFGVAKSSTERSTITVGSNNGASPLSVEKRGIKTNQFITRVNFSATPGIVMEADFVSMDSDGFTFNKSTAPNNDIASDFIAFGDGILSKIGKFTQPTSTGNQSVTGVGFEPSLVMFFSSPATAEGLGAPNAMSIGAATSSTERFVNAHSSLDAVETTAAQRRYVSNKCISVITANSGGTPTVNAEADLVSMDSDGFTVNWGTADANERIVFYLALGENPGGTQSVSGSTTPTGALTKKVSRTLAGSSTGAGALSSQAVLQKSVEGEVTPAGSLSTNLTSGRTINGSSTATGSVATKLFNTPIWRTKVDWDSGQSQNAVSHPDTVLRHGFENINFSPPIWFSDNGLHTPFPGTQGAVGFYDEAENVTYIAYSGKQAFPEIGVFDHGTKTFASHRMVTNNSNHTIHPDVTHGQPTITMDDDGYIYLFFSSHGGNQFNARTDNPRDLNSWTVAELTGITATYPHPFVHNGHIYFLFRERGVGSPPPGPITLRKAPLADWNIPGSYVQTTLAIFDPTQSGKRSDLYVHGLVIQDGKLHMSWNHLDSPGGSGLAGDVRFNVYFAVYDLDTEVFQDIQGNSITTPLSKATAEANSNIFVYDTQTAGQETAAVRLALNSSGVPHIIFTHDIDGAGDFQHKHVYWNGTAWTTPAIITATQHTTKFRGGQIHFDSSDNLHGYLTTGDGIEHWTWDGSNWTEQSVLVDSTTYRAPLLAGGTMRPDTRKGEFIFFLAEFEANADDLKIFGINKSHQVQTSLDTHRAGFWQFNEASGTALHDETRLSGINNTEIVGGVTLNEQGMLGTRAIRYPTTQSSANRIDTNSDVIHRTLSLANEGITVAAWIKFSEITNTMWICGARVGDGSGSDHGFAFRVLGAVAGNPLSLFVWNASGDNIDSSTASGLTTTDWHLVACSYRNSNKNVRFYVDGQLISTHTATNALSTTELGRDFYIGAFNLNDTGSTNHIKGDMDSFFLWSRVLTDAQHEILFNAKSAGTYTSSKKKL